MKNQNFNYIESLLEFKRQDTALVKIGPVMLGGGNPIRIQSMTDTDTKDTEATVNQIVRIIDAGADLFVYPFRVSVKLKTLKTSGQNSIRGATTILCVPMYSLIL